MIQKYQQLILVDQEYKNKNPKNNLNKKIKSQVKKRYLIHLIIFNKENNYKKNNHQIYFQIKIKMMIKIGSLIIKKMKDK